MERKIKVLLLVAEAWRSDDSGGNTLNNFVEGMKNVEFAQIYTDGRLPKNNVCKRYYQITRESIFQNFFSHSPVGKSFNYDDIIPEQAVTPNNYSIHSKGISIKAILTYIAEKIKPESVKAILNFIWMTSNWKTKDLKQFITSFDPDVIYAPCYCSPFHLSLTRYVKKITGLKIVTWSADDCYSLRRFSLNPIFWLNRFYNRHCLRKTYPYYEEFFSISEDEIEEMSPVVGKQMKILRKGVHVPEIFNPREVHTPIKFIYAGGMYINRHKSLIKIANAIRALNAHDKKLAELHIYSATQLDSKSMSLLNDGCSVFNHGLIEPNILSQIYQECDVAIHCESFNLKDRLGTRLSFSTKVIDCFQSGCAILAIAWKDHTALKYLQKEDAAICVTCYDEIENAVENIVLHPYIIKEYARKAYECEKRNHRIENVQKTLFDAFSRCARSI